METLYSPYVKNVIPVNTRTRARTVKMDTSSFCLAFLALISSGVKKYTQFPPFRQLAGMDIVCNDTEAPLALRHYLSIILPFSYGNNMFIDRTFSSLIVIWSYFVENTNLTPTKRNKITNY